MARLSQQNKAERKAKSIGFEPFDYLLKEALKAVTADDHKEAKRIAIELLPYVKPRLRSIEAKLDTNIELEVVIGGC